MSWSKLTAYVLHNRQRDKITHIDRDRSRDIVNKITLRDMIYRSYRAGDKVFLTMEERNMATAQTATQKMMEERKEVSRCAMIALVHLNRGSKLPSLSYTAPDVESCSHKSCGQNTSPR